MIKIQLIENDSVVVIEPQGSLSEADFEQVSALIDPLVERGHAIKGLMIYTKDFPGWESFSALVAHFKFVKSHHALMHKVALVTDSMIADIAEAVGGLVLKADIKEFDYDEYKQGLAWLSQ